MSGPYILSTETISRIVPRSSIGAYILSKNGANANYVGRSDLDLASRLSTYCGNNQIYSHFWYETTNSVKAAFDLECNWWHTYKPGDNQNHPDRPSNSNWQCPICSIFGRGW